jgi:aminoglycoside phosphotransferase (APT) family kinase protein
MHADEIETDVALVRRLLAGQFPQWAELRIDPVASYGTDRDIYRLGERLIARLGDRIDGYATLRSWQASLDAPAWEGPGGLATRRPAAGQPARRRP